MTKLGPNGLAPGLNREQWEEAIILEADRFSLVNYKGQGKSTREEFDTLFMAVNGIDCLPKDSRALIYAIHKSGRSTLVNPQDYSKYIVARGEA